MKASLLDKSPAIRPARQVPRGTETILVVEDESAVRNFIVSKLESCGYAVLAAAHGYAALLEVKFHPGTIDLLLTDVMMKWKNGVHTAEEVKALQPGIKILFMSGFTEEKTVLRAIDSGAFFLAKPFTPTELALRVREVLDRAERGNPVSRLA